MEKLKLLSLSYLAMLAFSMLAQPLAPGAPATAWRKKEDIAVAKSNLQISPAARPSASLRQPILANSPLMVYSGLSLSGSAVALEASIIYAGSSIPGGLNNQIESFVLRRGHMATLAIHDNGTGKSKVYIAAKADLIVDSLPAAMRGKVSFVRVLPWREVTKKGTGGLIAGLNAGWFYNWSSNENTKPDLEYVPMAWGAGGASPSSVSQIIQKANVTHLLGFNESDNCNDQSGQFNNLCQPEVAVAYYENLMGTGLRLGTPAPRENGPTTWLKEFSRIAKDRDVRFDFVAVHWYDWGATPQNSPNADPQQVFNRFKAYLTNVYQIYGLPIWITEFNANPNRENSVQAEFLKLALPYLEQLDYVERYAYFQPDPRNASIPVAPANYFDANGNITNIGIIYRDQVSTPAILPSTWAAPNNLGGMDQAYAEKSPSLRTFEAECGGYQGNKWEIKKDTLASNNHYLQANIGAEGATELAQQTHFEFESNAAETLRLWVRLNTTPGTNGSLKIRMDDGAFVTISGMNATAFTWFRIPRFYELAKGRHRLTLQYVNAGTRLDQLVLSNGSPAVDLSPQRGNTACAFSTPGWGLNNNPVIYWLEGESPARVGVKWLRGADSTAIGQQFIQPAPGVTATDAPPGAEGLLTYTFQVAHEDEFSIWGKVQALTPDGDAFWFSVDEEPFRKWDGFANSAFQWKWNKFYFSDAAVNRPFTYFLAPGSHTLTLAYAEAGPKLDRLAIASATLNPASVDPDILQANPSLDFEAEQATILGTAAVVACVRSANGKQVNMGTSTNNGVRFDQVAVPVAGDYRLTVAYMSAVPRNVRLRVNNVDRGILAMSSSGAWCFNGGAPADFHRSIPLNAGVNTIEFRPTGVDAPFIDKISLVREVVSLEAELAQRTGGAMVANCAGASNGAGVQLGGDNSSRILFSNIALADAGSYSLDVAYVTKASRDAHILVNGGLLATVSFPPSGNWCEENGTPVVKSLEVALQQGMNRIEIKPTGADAPFFDKIALLNKRAGGVVTQVDAPRWSAERTPVNLVVYPNPSLSAGGWTLQVQARDDARFNLRVLDAYGRSVLSRFQGVTNQPLRLQEELPAGLYLLVIQVNDQNYVRKLIIQ